MTGRSAKRIGREQRSITSKPQGIRKQEQRSSRKSERLRNKSVLYGANSHLPEYRETEPSTQTAKRKRVWNEDGEVDVERLKTRKKSKKIVSPRKRAASLEGSYCTSKELEGISTWRRSGKWPAEYFEQDENTRANLLELSERQSSKGNTQFLAMERANHIARDGLPLARKRSSNSLRRQSAATNTPSDQRPREEKGIPYNTAKYETLLNTAGIFMHDAKSGPSKRSLDMCRRLLMGEQPAPKESRFSDTMFATTCERVRCDANEAKVVDKIARLVVPSVEDLADSGFKDLEHMVESHNAGWNNCNSIKGPRPQPDYSVGFGRSAFTEDQLQRLEPFVGGLDDTSALMATYFMYFPSFTCEIKCGAQALDTADRQNAQAAGIAVRGIVDLFKLAKREKELHRELLTYSISHDHRNVRIYGYYPVIEDEKGPAQVYRRTIHAFDFTVLDGKERWTSRQFTINLYTIWMPELYRLICSAINDIPTGVNFELSEPVPHGPSELLQDIQGSTTTQTELEILRGTQKDAEERAETQYATPDTSISQVESPERPKKRTASSPKRRQKRNARS